MQFEIDGPSILAEHDQLTAADPIRRGDLVWFDRTGPNTVMLRLAPAPAGVCCYRIDRGAAPDTLSLTAVRGGE